MPSPGRTFLSITDLHFNSCYDSALIEKLAGAEPDDWSGIFETASGFELSAPGTDTNYPLLKFLFSDMASFADVDFVLFSGDFLGHRLQEQYQAGTKDTSGTGFKLFIAKTVSFLAGKFQEAFPGKIIFPCMGNDDTLCGDYEITPLGEFLSLFAESWQPIMDLLSGPDQRSFAQTFPIGGYYTAMLPGMPNHRLIVLNNIFMSQKYRDGCGKKPGDPALAQLSWLEWIFYISRAQNEKVWLVFHEPMGINIYPALHGKSPKCADNVETFMKTKYGDALRKLLTRSSRMIEAAFCGHTHMDEFRILHDGNDIPLMYMHVTPSVSPVFGNNPAYQVFTLDPQGQVPADYITRMVNLSETLDPGQAVWKEAYRFSDAYRQTALNPETLTRVRNEIADNETIRNRYIEHYAVNAPKYSLINKENWQAFYDCIWDNTKEAFIDDYCPEH